MSAFIRRGLSAPPSHGTLRNQKLPDTRWKRLILSLALVMCLGLMVAAPAGATSDTVVNVFACAGGDGTMTVPSGVPITIHGNGFAQGSYGLIRDFLLKEHTTLTLSDGTTAVYDLSPEWGAPVKFSPTFWVTSLPDTDLGISLNPGQSILVTLDITFDPALLVAFPPVGPSGDNGPFLVTEDGPASCLITADT